MNKWYTFLFLVAAARAFGQDAGAGYKKHSLSISGGVTSSTVYGSMVERNNQFGENVTMTNRTGFLVQVFMEKQGRRSYIKYGMGYVQKQVNPMNGTYALYKDHLKTGYLSLPVLSGIRCLHPDNPVNVQLEAGPVLNIKLVDKSITGPDRVGFDTKPFVASVCGGAVFSFSMKSKMKFLFQYRYTHDVTNSYVERLYWNSDEPNKKFTYRYKTHHASLGLQFPM